MWIAFVKSFRDASRFFSINYILSNYKCKKRIILTMSSAVTKPTDTDNSAQSSSGGSMELLWMVWDSKGHHLMFNLPIDFASENKLNNNHWIVHCLYVYAYQINTMQIEVHCQDLHPNNIFTLTKWINTEFYYKN